MPTAHQMPAGRYYIGDLCYVMHPEWDEFCAITIQGTDVLDGVFELADGRKFATYTTACGDGFYRASNGAEICVDAGLIGCIKVDDIRDPSAPADKLGELGAVVEFGGPFTTSSAGGVIRIGHITVDTSLDDDDDGYGY